MTNSKPSKTPTRRAANLNATEKSAPRSSQAPKKRSPKKRSLKMRFLIFTLKMLLMLSIVLTLLWIYFYQVMKERVENNVWDLPATIYSRIYEIRLEQPISQEKVIDILKASNYRQELMATRPGDFVVHRDSIEIYRRAFTFPEGDEPARMVQVNFQKGQLTQIIDRQQRTAISQLSIDPKLMTMIQSTHDERRLFMALNEFPETLINTLLATEDRQFFKHDGVNFISIARAVVVNLTSNRTEGASTLTQQLIKNLFLSNERSYVRKLKEFYMALIMDRTYSKGRILELYLNEVYLGQDGHYAIHGFPLASQYYFGRPVNELSLDQQALLVGMLKGPALYNPWTRPEKALERRNVVLNLIYEQGIIDQELLTVLKKRPLGVLPKGSVIISYPTFVQSVNETLKQFFGDQFHKISGTKLFTTFDPIIHRAAEQSIEQSLPDLKKRSGHSDLQVAMVVIDRKSGELRTIIGSNDPGFPGFNRATKMRRQIGSLVKPAIYLTALSQPNRYQLNTLLDDTPIKIEQNRGDFWQPQNYDHKFRGFVPLIDALAYSYNVPTVHLGMALGLKSINQTLQNLGAPNSELKMMPSMLLGALDLTPLEMAQVYQTLANLGFYSKVMSLRSILDEEDRLIYQSNPHPKQAASIQGSYLTLFALQEVTRRGTARSLNARYSQLHLAGKTGTTNDNRDSWYAGIDGENVVVIWVGLDNHQSMNLTGSSGALTIYKAYLEAYNATPLILPKIKNIKFMGIDAKGQWRCQPPYTMQLPVWETPSSPLCINGVNVHE